MLMRALASFVRMRARVRVDAADRKNGNEPQRLNRRFATGEEGSPRS